MPHQFSYSFFLVIWGLISCRVRDWGAISAVSRRWRRSTCFAPSLPPPSLPPSSPLPSPSNPFVSSSAAFGLQVRKWAVARVTATAIPPCGSTRAACTTRGGALSPMHSIILSGTRSSTSTAPPSHPTSPRTGPAKSPTPTDPCKSDVWLFFFFFFSSWESWGF